MSKKQRKSNSGEEKVPILKRHLVGKESVSDICDDLNFSPNQFYHWAKAFFESGAVTFKHWHIDITYLNLNGTFYYLCSVLDGFSRYIWHWEIRERMKERDVEIILARAKEKFPDASPRIISDNSPQFIARDFREYIRLSGINYVRTSPFYPQSNDKQERMQDLIKQECIRPKCPRSLEEGRVRVAQYVYFYSTKRFYSAVGYIAPMDMLMGRQKSIHQQRDQDLQQARILRKQKRNQAIEKMGA